MDPQAIRITIELPQGVDVQASGGTTGGTVTGTDRAAASGGIDAGSPPAALVAALGDPAPPTAQAARTDPTVGGPAGEALDAGSFPARLAADMEAAGPRHPFDDPATGMATAMSPILDRESRN